MTDDTTKELARQPRPGCLRRALAPAMLVLVIAALVAAPMYLLLYRPLEENHRALQANLAAAEALLAELRPLVPENQVLKADLARAETQQLALQALVHVNDARVAMALGEPTQARMPILLAEGVLAGLEARVDPSLGDSVAAMRDRLRLARGEFESDAFAAQRDLEILANDLAKLAKDLAGT